MQLENYFSEESGKIRFSRQQASDFAKGIAGDFNPIHDIDARRFCVPGDLLFAMVLVKSGLQKSMRFHFSGMVTDVTEVLLQRDSDQKRTVIDDNEKVYLTVDCEGDETQDSNLISDLVHQYVSFSGKTFPHIMVPLMQQNDVMINPDRPMVIYESMEINLQRLDISDPQLVLSEANLTASGKRGEVTVAFDVVAGDEIVGGGKKKFLLSGLRPFEAEKMDDVVREYDSRKQKFLNAGSE
ncbi:MAG TPA: DUF3581 domain-containing protein [Gammaproteobacteria bacterium]|jgi:hypothetical protein|nr:DUF3581 domain-containing protein [Gammaproteobacteria bacterium]